MWKKWDKRYRDIKRKRRPNEEAELRSQFTVFAAKIRVNWGTKRGLNESAKKEREVVSRFPGLRRRQRMEGREFRTSGDYFYDCYEEEKSDKWSKEQKETEEYERGSRRKKFGKSILRRGKWDNKVFLAYLATLHRVPLGENGLGPTLAARQQYAAKSPANRDSLGNSAR